MSDTTVSPLRAAREHMGLSREKVAAELGLSSKTIERWEKGLPVKLWQLMRLAELYGVTVEALQDGGEAAA